jgi:hypothetical protein
VNQLTGAQAKALAAMAEADQELTRMQAEGIPEDDPRFMEALEEYQRLGAEIALGPDSAVFLIAGPGDQLRAFTSEPEAN